MERLPDTLWQAVGETLRPWLLSLHLSLAWTLVIEVFPAVRKPAGLLGLTVAFLPIFLWVAGPTWFVINLLAYGTASFLVHSESTTSVRWNRACVLMIGSVLLYTVAHRIWAGGIHIPFNGRTWQWNSFDMFLLLRWVVLLWESGSGKVRTLAPSRFLIWTVLPVTCFGPFFRYSQFLIQWDRMTRPDETCGPNGTAWWRQFLPVGAMLAGLCCIHYAADLLKHSSHNRVAYLLNTFLFGPWGFLLLIGAILRSQEILGQRMGLVLPPSFVRPFGRTNLSDFWANWNMSVTGVFRDLLFYNRWGQKKANPYVNSIILFTLVGLWHNPNAYWLLWGFLHGCAFAGFLGWRKYRDQICPIDLRSRIPRRDLWSAALTYTIVCAMWTIPSVLLKFLGNSGTTGTTP